MLCSQPFHLENISKIFTPFEQLVLPECIHAYQSHASESGGSFASPADRCFYEMARTMFDKMGEYASLLCVSLPEFFSMDIEKTSTGCCDVRLAITRQMARFKANQKRDRCALIVRRFSLFLQSASRTRSSLRTSTRRRNNRIRLLARRPLAPGERPNRWTSPPPYRHRNGRGRLRPQIFFTPLRGRAGA